MRRTNETYVKSYEKNEQKNVGDAIDDADGLFHGWSYGHGSEYQ